MESKLAPVEQNFLGSRPSALEGRREVDPPARTVYAFHNPPLGSAPA